MNCSNSAVFFVFLYFLTVSIVLYFYKKYRTIGTVQKSRKTKNTTLLEQFKNLEKQKKTTQLEQSKNLKKQKIPHYWNSS
jgi:predicted Holliday junction resolvase-like endonuclease